MQRWCGLNAEAPESSPWKAEKGVRASVVPLEPSRSGRLDGGSQAWCALYLHATMHLPKQLAREVRSRPGPSFLVVARRMSKMDGRVRLWEKMAPVKPLLQ